MGKYGSTAVRAAGLLRNGSESAEEAWRSVAQAVFTKAPESRNKACPREAFLGLCAAGLVRGVPTSTCIEARCSLNRGYAFTAVRLLAAHRELARGTKIGLWRRVLRELKIDKKRHNEQMDVVVALWEERLIVTRTAVNQTGKTVQVAEWRTQAESDDAPVRGCPFGPPP